MPLPAFNNDGDLPPGVHRATLAEVLSRFGQGSIQRRAVAERLSRLYHLAIVVTGLSVAATGLFMMKRVRTPLFVRDPYILGDSAWGVTYVAHGLAGVGLVGLVIAHVYFAVRPEKWWITKSMILGWITRRQYLEHHEPSRWRVGRTGTSSAAKPAGHA